MDILDVVYNWVFFAGVVFGAILMRVIQHGQCYWLDRHYPLPNGRKRRVSEINWTMGGALLAVASVGYVLVQVNQAEENTRHVAAQTRALAEQTQECTSDLIESIDRGRAITLEDNDVRRQNDDISKYQRELVYEWMHDLIFPPSDIASLPGSHPAREKYALDLTIRTDQLFEQSIKRQRQLDQQQREIDQKRAENNKTLPPDCGQ